LRFPVAYDGLPLQENLQEQSIVGCRKGEKLFPSSVKQKDASVPTIHESSGADFMDEVKQDCLCKKTCKSNPS
jgi:hypothetical protein